MNKIYSFLINSILFLVFLSFWINAYIIAAGFLEITFKWNIENPEGGGVIVLLTFITAGFLYFYLPLKRYRGTPGWGIISRIKGEQPGLKPFVFYCKVLGIMVIAYLLTWGASIIIFSPMVKKQERVLESMGMSLDWRSYYPEWDEKDNAAPYLKQAWSGLKGSYEKTGNLFDSLKKNPESIKDISRDIDNLLNENAESIKLLDEALKFHKVAWGDYRKLLPIEVPIPEYSMFRGFVRLWMLDAINSAYRNDYQQAEKSISRATGLFKLLEQDPMLIPAMARIRMLREICDGLTAIVKVSINKPEGFVFVRKVIDVLPTVYGSVRKAIEQESSSNASMQKESYENIIRYWRSGASTYIFLNVWNYNVWNLWDRYCLLKIAEFEMTYASPDNTPAAREAIGKRLEDFVNLNSRMPAYIASVGSGNYYEYVLKEVDTTAIPDAVLLFASAVDYRRVHGRYPETLDKLVPEYYKELPKSPADGKPYIYNTSKDFMEVYIVGAENKHIPDATVIGERPKP